MTVFFPGLFALAGYRSINARSVHSISSHKRLRQWVFFCPLHDLSYLASRSMIVNSGEMKAAATTNTKIPRAR